MFKLGINKDLYEAHCYVIIVMDLLKEDLRDSFLLKLFYTNDLILCVDSVEEVMGKCDKWKVAVAVKYLRENVGNRVNVCRD